MNRRLSLWFLGTVFLMGWPRFALSAVSIPLTVNMSEAVTVDTSGGTPRIAVDVGGTTRYATYTSGSGTSALTFTLVPTVGDVDLDGIAVSSPVDLNGGTIKDAAGNNAALTFTVPNTSGVKVDYPSLSMDFVNNDYILSGTHYASLPSFLSAAGGTYSRTSVGTYYDSAGVLQTAASGTPRFDYDPVTHTAKGILIEDSRTNMFQKSDDMTGAPWQIEATVTVTSNAVQAPDGNTTAESTSNYYPFVKFYDQTNSSWVTAAQGYTPTVNWQRFSFTVTTPATCTTLRSYLVRNDSTATSYIYQAVSVSPSTAYTLSFWAKKNAAGTNVHLWGAQFEQGAFATSYIPTTSAAVTRATDILRLPTGGWYNAANGTLLSQFSIPVLGGTKYPGSATLDDTTNQNSMGLAVADGGADLLYAEFYTGGVNQFAATGAAYTAGTTATQAFYYDTNAARLANNGVLGVLDTSVTVPTVSTLRVGALRGSSDKLNGDVAKVKYYPLRTSDTQLQLLTQ